MTIDEFMERLKVTRVGEWTLIVPNWGLTDRMRVWENGPTCPVCAVAGLRGIDADAAGRKLGLSALDTGMLANAADSRIYGSPVIRARMLDACGLGTTRADYIPVRWRHTPSDPNLTRGE